MGLTREEIADAVTRSTYFSDLTGDAPAIADLASKVVPKHFAKGSLLVKEGEMGDSVYIIVRGEVRIVKKTLAGEDYTVVTISFIENPGAEKPSYPCIGELALFDSEKRSASALAETDVEVLVLSRDSFDKFVDAYPRHAVAIFRKFAKTMSRRLRAANQDIVTLFEALFREVEGDI